MKKGELVIPADISKINKEVLLKLNRLTENYIDNITTGQLVWDVEGTEPLTMLNEHTPQVTKSLLPSYTNRYTGYKEFRYIDYLADFHKQLEDI